MTMEKIPMAVPIGIDLASPMLGCETVRSLARESSLSMPALLRFALLASALFVSSAITTSCCLLAFAVSQLWLTERAKIQEAVATLIKALRARWLDKMRLLTDVLCAAAIRVCAFGSMVTRCMPTSVFKLALTVSAWFTHGGRLFKVLVATPMIHSAAAIPLLPSLPSELNISSRQVEFRSANVDLHAVPLQAEFPRSFENLGWCLIMATSAALLLLWATAHTGPIAPLLRDIFKVTGYWPRRPGEHAALESTGRSIEDRVTRDGPWGVSFVEWLRDKARRDQIGGEMLVSSGLHEDLGELEVEFERRACARDAGTKLNAPQSFSAWLTRVHHRFDAFFEAEDEAHVFAKVHHRRSMAAATAEQQVAAAMLDLQSSNWGGRGHSTYVPPNVPSGSREVGSALGSPPLRSPLPSPPPSPPSADAYFRRRMSRMLGGGAGLFCTASPPCNKFRINYEKILSLGEMSPSQRESHLNTLSQHNNYYLDIGAPGVRESVIFEGAEISWEQLLSRVTFTPRPFYTFIVMSPVHDLMNTMNDFGWRPYLCSYPNESAAQAEYERLADEHNHARFVEEVAVTGTTDLGVLSATIVGLVAVFFRNPTISEEVGVTCGWGLWSVIYRRGRLNSTNTWNAKALARIAEAPPPAVLGRDATNYLTFQAANAIEPGWTKVYYKNNGSKKPFAQFMNPNVPECSAIRKISSLTYPRLVERILRLIGLGAAGTAGKEDIVRSFLLVQNRLQHRKELAHDRGGLSQVAPSARASYARAHPRPTPRPIAKKPRRTYKEWATAEKQKDKGIKTRQLYLDVINLLEPGWTLINAQPGRRAWKFFNTKIPAHSSVVTGLNQTLLLKRIKSKKAELRALPAGPSRELVSRLFML